MMSGISRFDTNNDYHQQYPSALPDDRNNFSQINLNLASTIASNSSSVLGNTTTSKSVLAALRALQDKIKRLEAEKTQALDEIQQLRLQLQNQEIEFDHIKQKDKLILQKSVHEIRTSYDSVLTDKNDLEHRLQKLDERNNDLRLQSDNFHDQIQVLENEKYQQECKYKDLEGRYLQLEVQLEQARQRESGMYVHTTMNII
jgi:chromosome segregation ATPase